MVLNATVNATLNATTTVIASQTPLTFSEKVTLFVDTQAAPLVQAIFERFLDFLQAPLTYPEMRWIILPLFFTLLVMELYFHRYRHEELGWNTAVGNGVVLIFVSIDLFRQIYGENLRDALFTTSPSTSITTIVAMVVGLWGLSLMLFNFFHVIPRRFAFLISSSLPVNVTAYLAVIIVYTHLESSGNGIPIDTITIFAALVLYLAIFLIFTIIGAFVPRADETIEETVEVVRETLEEEQEEEKEKAKEERKHKKDIESNKMVLKAQAKQKTKEEIEKEVLDILKDE